MKIDTKIFNSVSANPIHNTLLGSYTVAWWGLFQACKDGSNLPVNVITLTLEEENHIIISVGAKNSTWQNSTSVYDKYSQQSGYRGNVPQYRKGTSDKPTANLRLNGEKLKALLRRSGTRPLYKGVQMNKIEKNNKINRPCGNV